MRYFAIVATMVGSCSASDKQRPSNPAITETPVALAVDAGIVNQQITKVTIQEGLHMLEVFALIESAGIAEVRELEALARDAKFLLKHGITGETIDGYLFPDTYEFAVPTTARLVLETMVKRQKGVWDRLQRTQKKSLSEVRKQLEWTDYEFLIMASIVQKEAASTAEQASIAQVYMNRLASPQFPNRLDSDLTIRYGCKIPQRKSAACQAWDINDRLRRKQLDDFDNPYNTFQHKGLPPGPICNPGTNAMKAVTEPDGSKYLFFIHTNAGLVFAETSAEHEHNVDKYIRNR